MTACLFCRIAAGEIPATIIYQDDHVVVFRDINPQAPTHVLIIPRKHIPALVNLTAEDDALLGYLVRISGQMAKEEGIAERGFRLIANNGREAGQSVDHVHFHLIGGRPLHWPPG